MPRPLLAVALLGLLLACETKQPESRKSDPPKSGDRDQLDPQPQSNTCLPPGLENASKIELLPVPRGCQIVATGDLLAPTIVRDPDQLAAAITCEPGVELPTIDFATHQLHLAVFMLSPAHAGSELRDDGQTLTYVQRDRSPCPDDPRPMPIGSSIAYLLPLGAERSYAKAACPLPPQCD